MKIKLVRPVFLRKQIEIIASSSGQDFQSLNAVNMCKAGISKDFTVIESVYGKSETGAMTTVLNDDMLYGADAIKQFCQKHRMKLSPIEWIEIPDEKELLKKAEKIERRNSRFAKLTELMAPEEILLNEWGLLYLAVEELESNEFGFSLIK